MKSDPDETSRVATQRKSGPEVEVTEEHDAAMETVSPEKIYRKRQKKLFVKIRNQMEFYFSQSNLQKDRFLRRIIDQTTDGYVDISIFSKFNKIAALTDDMTQVAKALTGSKLIQVSGDRAKIRRSQPIIDAKDVDDRTVYVEGLPADADHDWLRSVFQHCGEMLYISLPRYQSTGDYKGFAFIEFHTRNAADTACQLMNNPPTGSGDRIGRFPRWNKMSLAMDKQIRRYDLVTGEPRLDTRNKRPRTVSESAAVDAGGKHGQKRPRRNSEGTDAADLTTSEQPEGHGASNDQPAEPEAKKRKTSDDEQSNSESPQKPARPSQSKYDAEATKSDSEAKKTKVDENSADSDSSEEEKSSTKKVRISSPVEMKSAEPTKKKRKARKRVVSGKTQPKVDLEQHLRVIPKKDWLDLKTEYLQLQKESMKQLKSTLRDHAPKPNYKGGQKHNKPETQDNTRADIEFVANVLLSVTAVGGQPLDRKIIKERASRVAAVAYVDAKDGHVEGTIRCQSEADATKLVHCGDDLYNYTPLQGEAETLYWERIKSDRADKFSNKHKPSHKRGRDKIFKKAEKILKTHQAKHVVFNDD